jgi:hypothetical protein
MGLLVDTDDSYTRTGKGWFGRWSSKLSLVPIVGAWLALPFGAIDTLWESARFAFRGQFGSAATSLVAGTVATTVNTISSGGFGSIPSIGTVWWGNAASGIASGATLGTHARALTESVIGGISGALGSKPRVLSSHTAGLGAIGGGMSASAPGPHMSNAARSRGEDPDAAYRRLQSSQSEHLAALEAARANGPQQRAV